MGERLAKTNRGKGSMLKQHYWWSLSFSIEKTWLVFIGFSGNSTLQTLCKKLLISMTRLSVLFMLFWNLLFSSFVTLVLLVLWCWSYLTTKGLKICLLDFSYPQFYYTALSLWYRAKAFVTFLKSKARYLYTFLILGIILILTLPW